MSFWVITSWVFVAAFTALNIFLFLKLKKASEQMMKMAFPSANNMGEAMKQMQSMLGGMRGGMRPGQNPFGGAGGRPPADLNDQMKKAMEMISKMQQGKR